MNAPMSLILISLFFHDYDAIIERMIEWKKTEIILYKFDYLI